MNRSKSLASLAQRRVNVLAIAKRRREAEKCKRGHNNWYRSPKGRRYCRTCNNDSSWYRKRGLKHV